MAETIKTLKPSGGDYTSISAWVSGESKALGVDAVDVLECYKGDYTALGGGTNYIIDDSIISGWSNITPTAYAAIRTPATERHNGKAYDAVGDYTGFTVKKSSIAEHSSCIRDNQQRTHTLGLIIALDKTSGYGDLRALDIGAGGGYGVHGKHIAVSESLATSGGNYISGIAFLVDAQYYTDRTVSLYDSLAIGKGDGATGKWRMGVSCAGSHVYNCTVLHADVGYSAAKPSNEYASVYNCIAESNAGGTCYADPGMAGDYNLANDATAPGINSVQSATLTYTDAANGDYSLASTDTAAIGAGADDPGAGLYSDDILSVAFVSPWDMGAFKYSATASTTYTKSALLDSILERQGVLRTASIEAALQREKIERISSIDSSLQSSAIIMASLDAQIQNVINIASAIDAILRSGNSAEASLDSILQIKKSLSVSADSILTSSGNYVSSTIDAALLKQSILSVLSLDAELRKQGLLTASSIDSALQAKSLSIAANTDSALRKLRTIISAIDAIMVTGGTSIISSLDAMLSATKSLVSNIDSALGKERNASVSINGILALTGLLTSAMDAVLTGATTISVALNSLIKKTGLTIAVAMDAILSGGLTMGCPTATVLLYVSADGSIIFGPSVEGAITTH